MSFPLANRFVWLSAALGAAPAMAATVDIRTGLNNLAITHVTYSINNVDVNQAAEATGVTNASNTPVLLKKIGTGSTPDLTFFNTAGAKVLNVNPQLAGTSGVGVFDNGVTTTSTAGLAAYATAVEGTSTDTDLRNFSYHDYLSPGPTDPAVADLDLHFAKALNLTDYLLVSERWGNSSFQLLALAANGQPYEGANTLRLGGSGGTPGIGYEVHDWNTGYAAQGNVADQAQALTLFSVARFFSGTQAITGPVYGLRIFNYDEADVKILGISDNTFSDNPDNPNVVPEPTAMLMSLVGGLIFLGFRRRPSA
ncbi:MAG: PEP-CTERM sorting domain-containing protein [Verrucomicrobiaceae bacterium]|nr:MAG: PEP-CTERM sorting domain-containing protein [Verrucomicrobiaceae bacterium]